MDFQVNRMQELCSLGHSLPDLNISLQMSMVSLVSCKPYRSALSLCFQVVASQNPCGKEDAMQLGCVHKGGFMLMGPCNGHVRRVVCMAKKKKEKRKKKADNLSKQGRK